MLEKHSLFYDNIPSFFHLFKVNSPHLGPVLGVIIRLEMSPPAFITKFDKPLSIGRQDIIYIDGYSFFGHLLPRTGLGFIGYLSQEIIYRFGVFGRSEERRVG